MSKPLGVAHLSALDLAPPDLVRHAADAGFASVGVRVFPATPGEQRYPMTPGSPMSRQTLRAMAETGVTVLDVEAFTLDGARGREQWLPALEAGAALGATVLNVIGGDADQHRLRESLAELVADGRDHGIQPSLEPIAYQSINTVAAACALSRETGCGIMLDVLHFVRAGGRVEDLQDVPADALRVIQLCDGPETPPPLPVPERMPLGQTVSADRLPLESRSRRQSPGEGSFPLRTILETFPATPVSIEVPDVAGCAEFGHAQHFEQLHRAYVSRFDHNDSAMKGIS
ncbi:sugar phosphate isomerase/epimerase family protein [Saccharopolyspora pogona]|uniref:sugar phosphate isomerase/epimerase family protein n=1 Tax=Saccharopolyspora pogona TaxID=333966 RepID=UPI001687C95C|nr:TIM barrel protein [Saccharopolyspora pogona]